LPCTFGFWPEICLVQALKKHFDIEELFDFYSEEMSFARFSYAIKMQVFKNKITLKETVDKNSRNKGNFVTSAFSATAVDRRNPFNYLKNNKNNLKQK
jgi:hypothetical protein